MSDPGTRKEPDGNGGPGGCALRKKIESGADLAGERLGLVTRDGAWKTVLFSTRPLRNRSGEAAGLVVVFRDVTELESLREEFRGRYRFHQLIAKSGKMQDLFRLIEQAAGSDATVVVEGETSTGKELVARAIHYNSLRANRPFVPVNCAALAEGILESELFGHVKGAFTGATHDKKGRFEVAEGGGLHLLPEGPGKGTDHQNLGIESGTERSQLQCPRPPGEVPVGRVRFP